VLGADACKSASARNPRPVRKAAAADEEPDTLRARDGAEGRNGERQGETAEDRPTERQPNGRDGARKSALARRHGGVKRADINGNGLTSKLRGASLRSRRSVPLERSVRR
jgi:hypothetical protein